MTQDAVSLGVNRISTNSTILCEADRDARTITFRVREEFGNGRDGSGIYIGPDVERKEAVKVFGDALDVICGVKHSVVPVERWVALSVAPSKA